MISAQGTPKDPPANCFCFTPGITTEFSGTTPFTASPVLASTNGSGFGDGDTGAQDGSALNVNAFDDDTAASDKAIIFNDHGLRLGGSSTPPMPTPPDK